MVKLCDQTFNDSFKKKKKLESLQYNAALVIIGAIRGFSNKKMYQEVGLESLRHRR